MKNTDSNIRASRNITAKLGRAWQGLANTYWKTSIWKKRDTNLAGHIVCMAKHLSFAMKIIRLMESEVSLTSKYQKFSFLPSRTHQNVFKRIRRLVRQDILFTKPCTLSRWVAIAPLVSHHWFVDNSSETDWAIIIGLLLGPFMSTEMVTVEFQSSVITLLDKKELNKQPKGPRSLQKIN